MSMFTIVDTGIDDLNAICQINAKYDCIPICMLLYRECIFFSIPINLFVVNKPVQEFGLQAH